MTTDPVASVDLVDALRRALGSNPGHLLEMPSALRSRLVTECGDDSTALSPKIHLVVAAADEQLPASLLDASPVDAAALAHISEALAASRGWSLSAARSTTETWAQALGVLADGVQVSPDAASPVVVDAPSPQVRQGIPSPGRRPTLDDDGTVRPETAETVLPGTGRGTDPEGTVLPQLSSVVAPDVTPPAVAPAPPQPKPADSLPGAPAAAPPAPGTHGSHGPAPWPATTSRSFPKVIAAGGPPPSGVYQAFHPRDPRMRMWVGLASLLVMIGVYLTTHFVAGPLLVALVVLVAWKAVPSGTLAVDEVGGRFFRKPGPGAVPDVEFAWSEVSVLPGYVTLIEAPAGKVWLGFGARALTRAVLDRTGDDIPAAGPTS